RSILVCRIEFSRKIKMEPTLTGLGVGGLVLILALREIRTILADRAGRKNGNGAGGASGNKPPEFWQVEFRKATAEVFETLVLPLLKQQTEILGRLETAMQKLWEENLKKRSRGR
ncbi:MAG: hypothetical protein ACRD3I_14590, partial [Terriglobales bacterium]